MCITKLFFSFIKFSRWKIDATTFIYLSFMIWWHTSFAAKPFKYVFLSIHRQAETSFVKNRTTCILKFSIPSIYLSLKYFIQIFACHSPAIWWLDFSSGNSLWIRSDQSQHDTNRDVYHIPIEKEMMYNSWDINFLYFARNPHLTIIVTQISILAKPVSSLSYYRHFYVYPTVI